VDEVNYPDAVVISPVGHIVSDWREVENMPLGGRSAVIRLRPDYQPALLRIGEHSHLWVLTWFHQTNRSLLRVRPSKVNPQLPEYGVFALRSAARPNPIALTLVKLEKVEGCDLIVTGIDAVDGTRVLDIKPYFEHDIVFSPVTPYIPPQDRGVQAELLRKQALIHHGEACLGLELGVRMALLAEERFGQLQSSSLALSVSGDPCLADVLQGLTRARLANPPRFAYAATEGHSGVLWAKDGDCLRLTVRPGLDAARAREAAAEDLFQLDDGCAPDNE